MSNGKLINEINLLVNAKYPFLLIESHEEERVQDYVFKVAELQGRHMVTWTVTEGLKWKTKSNNETSNNPVGQGTENLDVALTEIANYAEQAIFLMKDVHPYIEDPMQGAIIIRRIKDLHYVLQNTYKTVILVSPRLKIPLDLQKIVTIVDMPLPNKEELEAVLDSTIEMLQARAETEDEVARLMPGFEKQLTKKEKILQSGLGLTVGEFSNVIAKCLSSHNLSVDIINEEKKQVVRKSGMLEYFNPDEDMSQIGGLGVLKGWMRKAKKRFSEEARNYGLEAPRGILLIGPPGTGKSLSAKVAAKELQLPLLRLDMSDIASKYYGETSNNVKQALKLAEAVAPAVLWLDEIEKMFSTGSMGEGHEETMRAMGGLLTHFEESKSPIFRVATCNQPFNLKPELMQRFEKIFFVDLPNAEERKEIFAIHLRKVGRDPAKFDLAKLSSVTQGFVGREIRTIIKEGLATAFDKNAEVNTDFIVAEARRMTPTSIQKKAEIENMRKWAADNALNASQPEQAQQGKVVRTVEV